MIADQKSLIPVRNSANIRKDLPRTEVVFYRAADCSVPLLDWLRTLSPKVRDKCLARLVRLEQMGHELRRPEADYLRDGIYELRVSYRSLQYRMLYFFSARAVVVVSHGLIKETVVPPREIERAMERKKEFEGEPGTHGFRPKR
jgi:phage-related protein